MSIVSIIMIIAVIVGTALGALTGFFKKFRSASISGVTILLTLAIDKVIGTSVKKTGGLGYGLALLITVVVSLLIFSLAVAILQNLLNKAVEARLQLSHYKNHDNVEETEAYILSAVDAGNKREYKRQLKRLKKIKDSAGVWGFVDRVLGAVNGGLNVLVSMTVVVCMIMTFVDISGLGYGAFEGALTSSAWTKFGKAIALDLPLITVISMSIWSGYKSGISSVLCTVVVLGMLVGFGFASYSIATSEVCADAVANLANGNLLAPVRDFLGNKTELVAQILMALLIFILSLVVVILVAVFLPRAIEKFREDKLFGVADGVAGAIVLGLFVTAMFILFGGVSATLKDMAFIQQFNTYEAVACFGDAMYSCNPLTSVFQNLPLASWFATSAPVPESALTVAIG